MRISTFLYATLIIFLCHPVVNSFANDSVLNGTMELIVPKSEADLVDPNAEAVKAWYPAGEPQSGKGKLWEEGQSAEDINRRRTPEQNMDDAINTRPYIESQLKSISEYERGQSEEPVTFADGKIHSESSVEKSSWKPSIAEPVKIDEPILESQRNVVGAYAEMVDEDGLQISAGPELHLQNQAESFLNQNSSPNENNSELGMGMKFLWGF